MISIEYLAGLFDGEGYIGISNTLDKRWNKRYHAVVVTVTSTYLPILQEYQKRFGGSIASHKPKHGHKSLYHWQANGDKARGFLTVVAVYLIEKKAQAELALQLPRTSSKRAGRTPELLAEQERIYQEVKRLKHV